MGQCGSAVAVCGDSRAGLWNEGNGIELQGVPVYVNVYDLQVARDPAAAYGTYEEEVQREAVALSSSTANGGTTLNARLGFGVYHSGVQVFNAEYSFGGDASGRARADDTGIFAVAPRTALPPSQFVAQHLAGVLPLNTTHADVVAVLRMMRSDWTMKSYNLVSRNCNDFSQAFLVALTAEFTPRGLKSNLEVPPYVNRTARFGAALMPRPLLTLLDPQGAKAPSATSTAGSGTGTTTAASAREGGQEGVLAASSS